MGFVRRLLKRVFSGRVTPSVHAMQAHERTTLQKKINQHAERIQMDSGRIMSLISEARTPQRVKDKILVAMDSLLTLHDYPIDINALESWVNAAIKYPEEIGYVSLPREPERREFKPVASQPGEPSGLSVTRYKLKETASTRDRKRLRRQQRLLGKKN